MNVAPAPAGHLLPPIFVRPQGLAPYACQPSTSRGRLYPEEESATRTCYQRDRDRIIHSTAFRRLKHKTQVFVQHEGDYYRTRLTHSLEVAQIARSMARLLAVDEDLAEALSLAHDLGHTPFGHAGEEALNGAARAIGGFDHNAHTLRLVTRLEHRYAGFDGLNLTWETLEGLVKHNGPLEPQSARLPGPIAEFDHLWSLELERWPGVEAQIAALADDIAYVNHDIDDALRAGLFSVDDLMGAPLAGPMACLVIDRFGQLEPGRFIGEIVHRLMTALIDNVLRESRRRLTDAGPRSVEAVRILKSGVIGFSPGMEEQLAGLKDFLFAHMYRHPRVMESMAVAKRILAELFKALSENPELLPPDWKAACSAGGESRAARVARDYIAGMTDRFAILEHQRIFGREMELRSGQP
ncbi:MAG TPA: deoxyguanosinetriphosphate triphosphohydrolase [Rhizomicrobium sp.]|nr:deoxyguanosinetriphosphate triphosphohydrolase [Rhizomicrobium sp.]